MIFFNSCLIVTYLTRNKDQLNKLFNYKIRDQRPYSIFCTVTRFFI